MKILKDSVIYLAGELFAKSLPFLLLPYLSRKLGVAGFGELSYYQTFFALLLIVFGMSQDGAIARYYYVYGKRNLYGIMQAGYVYTMFMAAGGLLLAWLAQSLIFAVLICAAATQALLNVQLSLRQCQQQALAYTLIQLASGIAATVLTVALLEFTDGWPIEKRFAAIFLGNLAVGLAAWFVFRRQQPSRPRRYRPRTLVLCLMYLFSFGIPLLLHQFSGVMKGQLDRIVIFQLYPAAQLGIYAAAYQLAAILGVLLMALNRATVPHYYAALKAASINADTIKRWAKYSLLLAPLPAIIAALLPASWFLWVLGAQYNGVQYYTCLFLLGTALTLPYYILVNYLFFYGKTQAIAITSVWSAVAYVLILLPTVHIGLHWTPLAMILSNLLILPLLYRQVNHCAAAQNP
jgi:O-antigen/teichoic acid export membrane protein